MENTVVAIYDSYDEAGNACQALLDAGFSHESAQLRFDNSQAAGDAAAAQRQEEHGIAHFFRSLFGMEDEAGQHHVYAESVRRGGYVLTAYAETGEQAALAVEIMSRFDAVDVDARADQWRSQGWTGFDESAPMMTTEEIERERRGHEKPATRRDGVRIVQRANAAGSGAAQGAAGTTMGTTANLGGVLPDDVKDS